MVSLRTKTTRFQTGEEDAMLLFLESLKSHSSTIQNIKQIQFLSFSADLRLMYEIVIEKICNDDVGHCQRLVYN